MPIEYNRQALRTLRRFPDAVRERTHTALVVAQAGGLANYARPLQGFRGASVVEIRMPFSGDTYRVVYSVEAHATILVVHAFKKKSKQGIATPRKDVELIRKRLNDYRG